MGKEQKDVKRKQETKENEEKERYILWTNWKRKGE
jgi:hypothetical protein